MTTDMTLTKGHGYYELSPNSEAGRKLVARIAALKSTSIGTDYEGKNILLDSFFASAGLWCRANVLPDMSLTWGDNTFEGEAGREAMERLNA